MPALRSLVAMALSFAIMTVAVAWQNGGAKTETVEKIAVLQAEPAGYWKGNLHTHSLWSDGDDFPDMIADWYKRRGYHFLTLSDHNVLSEGERWVDVRSTKTDRSVALKKYVARFGETWVERRTKPKDENTQQARLKPLSEFRSILEEPGKYLLIQG